MSRSRMASVAQSIAAAARRDVDAAVARAVAQVEYEVPDRINAAIAARQRRFEDQQAAQSNSRTISTSTVCGRGVDQLPQGRRALANG